MKELLKNPPEGLVPSNSLEEQIKNIHILEEHHIMSYLMEGAHAKSIDELFHSTSNIPRMFEVYLILEFEKKRSLICDLLFTIHQNYPTQFPLEQYLFSTKKIFGIITQFRWAKEDTSFILKIIIAYLRNHASYISTESLLSVIMGFETYGPWTDDDIREIFVHTSCIEMIQTHQLMLNTKKAKLVSRKAIAQRRKRAQIPFSLYKHSPKAL